MGAAPGAQDRAPRRRHLEYGTKAVYGAVIGWASATALGAAELEISTVVVGLQPGDVGHDPRITIVRELGGGHTLIRTPRYQAYTELVIALARRGRDIAEIAGNRRILITVLAPKGPRPRCPAPPRCSRRPSSPAPTAAGSAWTSPSPSSPPPSARWRAPVPRSSTSMTIDRSPSPLRGEGRVRGSEG